MHYVVKNMFSVMVLSSIVSVCVAAEPSRAERKISVRRTDKESTVSYEMTGGEFVLIAKMSNGNAWPLDTGKFPRNSGALGLRMEVGVSFPSDELKWGIIRSWADKDSWDTLEWAVATKPDEGRIPLGSIAVPLKIEGLEVYLIMYRRAEEGMDGILVAISDDKQKITEYLRFLPVNQFDWETAFAPVSTANSPVGCSVDEQIETVIITKGKYGTKPGGGRYEDDITPPLP